MKVLVSTKEMQKVRKNDFCFLEDGELVHFGFECDGETVDGHCGCRRSMVGIENPVATTTFKVVDQEVSEQDIINKLVKHYVESWHLEKQDAVKIATEEAKELSALADKFAIGKILEKRGNAIQVRRIK